MSRLVAIPDPVRETAMFNKDLDGIVRHLMDKVVPFDADPKTKMAVESEIRQHFGNVMERYRLLLRDLRLAK